MSKWQPIETAPRDGTVIRVFDVGVNADGWFADERWHFLDVTGNNGWVEGYGPTHWMPLPAPPEPAP